MADDPAKKENKSEIGKKLETGADTLKHGAQAIEHGVQATKHGIAAAKGAANLAKMSGKKIGKKLG